MKITKFENIENILTIIITNNNIGINNKNIFTYPNINDNNHSDTIDCFIDDTNLNLENINYFDTSLEIAKMGHLVLYNLIDTEYLLIFCPDLNNLTAYQKLFIQFIERYIVENKKSVNIALYHQDTDTFSEHYIDDVGDKKQTKQVFIKAKNNR